MFRKILKNFSSLELQRRASKENPVRSPPHSVKANYFGDRDLGGSSNDSKTRRPKQTEGCVIDLEYLIASSRSNDPLLERAERKSENQTLTRI